MLETRIRRTFNASHIRQLAGTATGGGEEWSPPIGLRCPEFLLKLERPLAQFDAYKRGKQTS